MVAGFSSLVTFKSAAALTTAYTGWSIDIPVRETGNFHPKPSRPASLILYATLASHVNDVGFSLLIYRLAEGDSVYRRYTDPKLTWVIADPDGSTYQMRFRIAPISSRTSIIRVRAKLTTAGTGTLALTGRLGIHSPFAA